MIFVTVYSLSLKQTSSVCPSAEWSPPTLVDAGSFNNWQSNPLQQPQWKLSRFITLEKYAIFISILLFPQRLTICIFFPMAHFHEVLLGHISKPPIQMVQLRVKFAVCFWCCFSKAWHSYSGQIQKKMASEIQAKKPI